MKLAINAFNIRMGGGVTHLVELLSAAEPSRYNFSVVTVFGTDSVLRKIPDRTWLEKQVVTDFDRWLLKKIWWNFFIFPKLVKNFDILYLPGGSYLGKSRLFVVFFQNILPFDIKEKRRYLRAEPKIFFRLYLLRFIQYFTYKRSGGAIFPTCYAKEVIDRNLPGKLNEVSCKTIPHGINANFLNSKERENSALSQEVKLLYVSTVDLYKHQWLLIKAVGELRKRGINASLTLIGSVGGNASRLLLESAIKEVDREGEFIFFLGDIAYEDLPRFYQEADVFVFPSSCESISSIIQEAMASGLPIACSNRGAMSEILKDAGVYFDPEKPDEMIKALYQLIMDPALRNSCAKKAKQYSVEYTWKRCADETFSFFQAVAKGKTCVE